MRLTPPELHARADALEALQSPCVLCPRRCAAERAKGELGFCRASADPEVASYGPHYGEERELVGSRGSGTIFFSHCNLGCCFCQNYDISRLGHGSRVTPLAVAEMMLDLESGGCANINAVTPTHFAPQIVRGLAYARERGLELPLVYNCGGYESCDALRLLDGVVDVYMPDAKFADPEAAESLCSARDYPDVMLEALREMQRQVGDLEVGADGLATRGLLIRHLVMPGNLARTDRVLEVVARDVSSSAAINVMGQYRPCGEVVGRTGPIGRAVTHEEYARAIERARSLGLRVLG